MACTVTSGVIATRATTPKASSRTLPPRAWQAPIAKGSRKVAVMGPEATPPESNAMAVKMCGVTKARPHAMRYPGTSTYITGMCMLTRSIARPLATATPMERHRPIDWCETAPPVMSSTWRLSTPTAGSAETMKKPTTAAMATSTQVGISAASTSPK